MAFKEHQHTNSDGTEVTIWVDEKFDLSSIGARSSIGEGSSIGARSSIGEGSSIGEWSRIGARSIIGAKDECTKPAYMAPLPFGPGEYYITMTGKNIAIGCEVHTLEWWWSATDRDILALDGEKALEYWRIAKPFLFEAARVFGFWNDDRATPTTAAIVAT